MASKMGSGIAKYSKPSAVVMEKNPALEQVIALLSVRSEHEDFQGCGAIAAIVRVTRDKVLVQVTKQYAIGGQQYLENQVFFDNVKDAYKFAYGFVKNCYVSVAGRKFSVDILGETLN